MKVTFLFFLIAALAMLSVFQSAVEAAPQSEGGVAAEPAGEVDSPTVTDPKDGPTSEEEGKGGNKGHGKGPGKSNCKGKGKEHGKGKGKGKGEEMRQGKGKAGGPRE